VLSLTSESTWQGQYEMDRCCQQVTFSNVTLRGLGRYVREVTYTDMALRGRQPVTVRTLLVEWRNQAISLTGSKVD